MTTEAVVVAMSSPSAPRVHQRTDDGVIADCAVGEALRFAGQVHDVERAGEIALLDLAERRSFRELARRSDGGLPVHLAYERLDIARDRPRPVEAHLAERRPHVETRDAADVHVPPRVPGKRHGHP